MNQSPSSPLGSLCIPLPFTNPFSLACAILVLLFFSFPFPSSGQHNNLIDYKCGEIGNYTTQHAESTYDSNLDCLFQSLVTNASSRGGFSTATVNNSLFGLALCRGDVNSSICQFCVEKVTQDVKATCSYSKDAIMWFNYCYVRFSEKQFLQSTDNSPSSSDVDDLKVTLDEYERRDFNRIAKHLMNVTIEVAYSSKNRFASRQSIFRFNYPALYALAQCTPDLSGNDCNICLQGLLTDMSTDLSEAIRGSVHLGVRCILMYHIIFDSNFLMLPFPGSPQPPFVRADDAPATTENQNKGTISGGREMVTVTRATATAISLLLAIVVA
ncbi:cysteine-rich RECEPTOR-like kinase [Rhynchospora pubera]|uniref:Cysteine-rich RECEPTOR-like kinase n=1 Tax=Rhynchospora pubera TaxID=906938 RepID=A0AAV8E456_9POAL|nr:cysteine-rich RECEPTOR-like kinase [Rhynchospora pubera]